MDSPTSVTFPNPNRARDGSRGPPASAERIPSVMPMSDPRCTLKPRVPGAKPKNSSIGYDQ